MELTKELLEQYLETSQHHTLIIAILFILGFILNLAINYNIEKKFKESLSKFNSLLKKNEIKFSTYYNLKIEAYSKLYSLFFEFQDSNTLLFSGVYNVGLDKNNEVSLYRKRVKLWVKKLKELYYFFYRNKILFSTNEGRLQTKMDNHLQKCKDVSYLLIEDRDELDYIETHLWNLFNSGSTDPLIDYHFNQEETVKENISRLKNRPEVEEILIEFEKIKLIIETEFRELTKEI